MPITQRNDKIDEGKDRIENFAKFLVNSILKNEEFKKR